MPLIGRLGSVRFLPLRSPGLTEGNPLWGVAHSPRLSQLFSVWPRANLPSLSSEGAVRAPPIRCYTSGFRWCLEPHLHWALGAGEEVFLEAPASHMK